MKTTVIHLLNFDTLSKKFDDIEEKDYSKPAFVEMLRFMNNNQLQESLNGSDILNATEQTLDLMAVFLQDNSNFDGRPADNKDGSLCFHDLMYSSNLMSNIKNIRRIIRVSKRDLF